MDYATLRNSLKQQIPNTLKNTRLSKISTFLTKSLPEVYPENQTYSADYWKNRATV